MRYCDAGVVPISRGRNEDIMLVLSRQRDQSIVISDNVTITVVDVRGDKVRLGIEAPVDIPVHRQEVFDAIQMELKHPNEGESTTLSSGTKSAVTA